MLYRIIFAVVFCAYASAPASKINSLVSFSNSNTSTSRTRQTYPEVAAMYGPEPGSMGRCGIPANLLMHSTKLDR